MDGEQVPQTPFGDETITPVAPPLRSEVVEASLVQEAAAVTWHELAVVGAMVLLADITLYNGHGYAGCALFFLLAPALLLVGMTSPRPSLPSIVIGVMLVALAIKLLWCGSVLLVAFGFALTVALAMSVLGHPPFVLELIVYASQTVQAGYAGIIQYWRYSTKLSPHVPRGGWLNIGLPVAALIVFGAIFVLANPDLATAFGEGVDWFISNLRSWLFEQLPTPLRILFWAAAAWVTVGLLRPVVRPAAPDNAPEPVATKLTHEPAPLYLPFRNMLAVVIGLFAVYLVFEFATLWGRDFPDGFYYSGYAHEGAAWLTVALALATVILSLVFRGSILRDARLPKLRQLAWAWSLENVLLAMAVYNRLFIYVGFNGMTRMRIVGLFGISAVLVGFVVVLVKIAKNHSFVWLIRRQLWTLAIAVFLFALTPLDTIVVRYNVRRVLAGDLAPSVQISVHPISSEGIALLRPLLDSSNEIIREGGAAMLAEREALAEGEALRRQALGWTSYQIADAWALGELRENRDAWADYRDKQRRDAAIKAFDDYVYQWF